MRRWPALLVCTALAAAVSPAGAQDAAVDRPPAAEHRAVNVLPPGQSGFVSTRGQAQGQSSGDPDAYGEHLDDQRDLYWGFGYKDGSFHAGGIAVQPKAGVRIYRDRYGVPAVYADTGRDVWWGAGYAVAQDRLFLMDAVRRMGRGTFAELVGAGGVPTDIQQRVLTYSDAEYRRFFEALSQDAKDAITSYVEGANAWREEALADPDKLPAEYALLSTEPAEFTVLDVLAAGVLITRTVAADGGNEFANVRALRALERRYGTRRGRAVFRDFVWQEDPKAAVTITGHRFANQGGSPARRRAAFRAMADYAATLPLELESGPGTGDAPQPPSGGDVPLPGSGDAGGDGRAAAAATAVRALANLPGDLHGGSYAIAVGPSKTATGNAMLVSGPQLGYSYPSLLVELEVHGGGYDARGVSVPGLPTIGIGYGKRVAWALTSGYSKTIDSFIETVREGPGGVPQYRHDGRWKDQDCRTETVRYRPSAQGVPAGPPLLSRDVDVCRTVHGPVVATTQDRRRARSVQYAMFKRELQTIEGVLAWNRAQSFDEFAAGVAKVTWNENVVYADADGRIAYWHPGRYPRRHPDGDQRLPLPGTGAFDHDGRLPFQRMPHVIDPPQGFIANWNNKPAHGWYDGEGIGATSRPGGAGERVTALRSRLRRARDLTFTDLLRLEQRAGITDPRAREYLPLLRDLARARRLGPRQRDAVRRMLAWNGAHYGAGAGTDTERRTDGPAPTIFSALVEALREDLFAGMPGALVARQADVGSHVFDVSAADNLVLRILDPEHSGLAPSRDYARGRTTRGVLRDALRLALRRLQREHGSDNLDDYRRVHPVSDVCSLTGGVIGPCLDMPYQDRGSWIHAVAFPRPDRDPDPDP